MRVWFYLPDTVTLALLEFCVYNGDEYAELAVLYQTAAVLVYIAQRPLIIWALCGHWEILQFNVATLLVKE